MGAWVLLVLALLILVRVIYTVTELATLLCIIFSVLFWGGLAGIIISLSKLGEGSSFYLAASSWGMCLLALAFIVLVIIIFVDFFRMITFAPEPPIEFSHPFFPWLRFIE